jgi:type II secretory pathway pseudopilin PulG
MGTHKLAGFTIIETVLFLGISSLLIVTLIASTGASLNIQRYRDAAETFKSVLQQQYADLASVQNGRNDNWSCGSNAIPTNTATISDNRGQSNCSLLGKYVRIENDKISIYRVIGFERSTTTQLNDINSLKNNYILNVSKAEADNSTLEWGTQIAYPATINGATNPRPVSPRKVGILIVRSPDSGQVYTFSNSDVDVPDDANLGPATFANMLIAGNGIPGQGEQLMCINSNGLLANNDRAVYLASYASGASAVELRTNDYLASVGSSARC